MNTQTQIIPEIILETSRKAVHTLNVTKCVYFIVMPDGTIVDNSNGGIGFTAPPAKPKKSFTRKVPHGTYKRLYHDRIARMAVGAVECLSPTPEMTAAGVTLTDMQGTLSSMASTLFGNNSHKIHKNIKQGWVEILRTA